MIHINFYVTALKIAYVQIKAGGEKNWHLGAVLWGKMPQTKLLANVAHIVVADQLRCKHSRNADDYAT